MLRDGIDCISEIPASRWQWRDYFVGEDCPHGSHSSKWGGFIEGVDEFDPRFFNISPREALHIDPQERLFLEHAWQALEDSGYSRAALQIPRAEQLPGQVGVYVGVMYGEYNLSGSLASIANRVSHVLNVHGPSMTLDTMCSSSLTAIHIACEDLRAGRTDMGFAGGVNVSIHPGKYSMLSAGQFISRQGHCQSFGEGADGYIPGEGVGCVLLKRLQDAIADGDHIHAVIAASALNHGGKTNGYTVPNPNAQADVIAMALARAGVDPGAVSYIEAHGTGTKLGDPIEVAALSKTFGLSRSDPQSCIIGSVKSNIGHCESAAGIAGLTKIVLQLKHRQIAASLHSERLNPNIDFSASPFVVNQVLRPWSPTDSDGRPSPRIAGLSSFGAGGANAHFVIEEYVTSSPDCAPSSGSELIVLSAATTAQLMQRARDLLAAVSETTTTLASIAHTLQVGREPMATRLALLVASREDLIAKLELYIRGEPDQLCTYSGHIGTASSLGMLQADPDFESVIARWLADGKWGKVAQLWVSGLDLNWQRCLKRRDVPRASLPGYPFARERYWIDPVRASHASELVAERNASRDRADLGDVAAPHTVAAESRGVALPPLVELLPGQALSLIHI